MPRDMRSSDLHGLVLDGSAVRVPLFLELPAILYVSIFLQKPCCGSPGRFAQNFMVLQFAAC